jgi:hypothetical protein
MVREISTIPADLELISSRARDFKLRQAKPGQLGDLDGRGVRLFAVSSKGLRRREGTEG